MPPSADLPAALAIPARLEDVRRLAAHLGEVCTRAGVDELSRMDCELALVEAANNVIEHGYSASTEGEKQLTFAVTVADGIVRMVLADCGTPIPQACFEASGPVPDDAQSGRGMGIMRACLDEIAYTSVDGENRLVLIKRLA